MYSVDLNCDLGEGFGTYTVGQDEAIMPLITSVNIACGYHAGDPHTMRSTVKLALSMGAAIGAHPGLPDLVGFGRRNLDVSPQEVLDMVTYQIGALDAFVRTEGGLMKHVKPHGALYNMAVHQVGIADAIAEAVYRINPELILVGLSGSQLIHSGNRIGLHTCNEVFADRTYQEDGSLTARSKPDAIIKDPQLALKQVLHMVLKGSVNSQQGKLVPMVADTICIHGDGVQAVEFARVIREGLLDVGVKLRAYNYNDK